MCALITVFLYLKSSGSYGTITTLIWGLDMINHHVLSMQIFEYHEKPVAYYTLYLLLVKQSAIKPSRTFHAGAGLPMKS